MDELGFHRTLHRPGTLLDVGAHDGAFTLPFAALPDSRVLAFEPLPAAFARLQAAFGPTGVPAHVALHQAALGDCDGAAALRLPVLDGVAQEQWASTAKTYGQHGSRVTEQRHVVPVRRIDSLDLHDVTHLKIDAEGAEYAVLRGARETLRRCRPVLSVEIEERHREGSTWAVPAYLDALGYDTFWEHWDDWRPMSEFDRSTMHRASADPTVFHVSDPYVFVFYALPSEDAVRMLTQLRHAAFPRCSQAG